MVARWRHGPAPAAAMAAVLGAGLLSAQADPASRFRELYGQATAAAQDQQEAVADRQARFARALAAFLKIPTDHRDYQGLVPAGAWCATQSGNLRVAVQLHASSWCLGNRSDDQLDWYVRALAAGGKLDQAVLLLHGERDRHQERVAALCIAPGLVQTLLGGSDRLMRRGREAAGLWLFERQAELLARDPVRQANLGLALRHVGRLEAAQAAYRHALSLAPEDCITTNDLGLLLKGCGRHREAADALARSLGLQATPGSGAAGTNLGVLAVRTGMTVRPDPLGDVLDVLRQRPNSAMARRVGLDLLARKPVDR